MKYLIQTNSYWLFKEKVNEIIKKESIINENIYFMDINSLDRVEDIFNKYFTGGIFNEKKAIILKEPFFLNEKKILKKESEIVKKIFEMNSSNIIIFYLNKANISNYFLKNYKKNITEIYLKEPTKQDLKNYVKNQFILNKVNFDIELIKNLIQKSNNNFDILMSEVNKYLILLSNNNILITNEIIEKNSYDFKNNLIFKIPLLMINKEYSKLNKILIILKKQGVSPIMIIDYLLNEFTLFLQAKISFSFNLNTSHDYLNNFRFKNATFNTKKIDFEKLYSIYLNLFNASINLKNSKNYFRNYEILIAKIFYCI